jgi:hypothetical protein
VLKEYTTLIQEPWYREGRIKGLNIPGYTLFSTGGIDGPRAGILTTNKATWMLPGFYCKALVAVLIKYNEDGAERRLVFCSAYLPYNSKDHPRQRNLRNSCNIVRVRISI